MHKLAKFADARGTIEGKILSVVLAVLLAFSLVNAPAFVGEAIATEHQSNLDMTAFGPGEVGPEAELLDYDPQLGPAAEGAEEDLDASEDDVEKLAVALEIEGDAAVYYNDEEAYKDGDELELVIGKDAKLDIYAPGADSVTVVAVIKNEETEEAEESEDPQDPQDAFEEVELKTNDDGLYVLDAELINGALESIVVVAKVETAEEVVEVENDALVEEPSASEENIQTDGNASSEEYIEPEVPSEPEVDYSQTEVIETESVEEATSEVVEPEYVEPVGTEPIVNEEPPADPIEPEGSVVEEEPAVFEEPAADPQPTEGGLKPIVATGEEGVIDEPEVELSIVEDELELNANVLSVGEESLLLSNVSPLARAYNYEVTMTVGETKSVKVSGLHVSESLDIGYSSIVGYAHSGMTDSLGCANISLKAVSSGEDVLNVSTSLGISTITKTIHIVVNEAEQTDTEVDVDFFFKYPGVQIGEKWNAGDWLYAGQGKAVLPMPGKKGIAFNGPFNVVQSPTAFEGKSITIDGTRYYYAKNANKPADASTYDIQWETAVYTDGSTDAHNWDGENGQKETVTARDIYHINGILILNRVDYYNVHFRIQRPGETDFTPDFSNLGQYASGTPFSEINKPTLADSEGYTFDGWYSDESCTQKVSDSWTLTADTDFYGRYVPNSLATKDTTYTVKHVVDGVEQTNDTKTYTGTAWVNEENPTILIEAGSLAQNTYAGYKYEGISPSVSEGGLISSGATITLTYVKDESQTQPTSYTVKHVVDGEERTEDTQTYTGTAWVNDENPTIAIVEGSLNPNTYEGYKLDVVKCGDEIIGDVASVDKVPSETVIAFTYIAIEYAITYSGMEDAVLGEGISNPETYKVTDNSFKLNNPTKAGYTFNGWTGTGLNEPTLEVTIDQGSTGDREYTATWTADEARIVFDANGGTPIDDMVGATSQPIGETAMPESTRTGYSFDGWYASADFEGDKIESLPAVYPAGTTTYYAKWNANTDTSYRVEYYYQEKGEYPKTTNEFAECFGTTDAPAAVTLEDKKPKKDGYVLDEGASTLEGTVAADGSLVLKVCFKQQFTVIFDPGDHGTFSTASYTYTVDYNSNIVRIPSTNPDSTYYQFVGWKNGLTGDIILNFNGFKVTEDVTFIAQWEPTVQPQYTVIEYRQVNGEYSDESKETYTRTDCEIDKEVVIDPYEWECPEGYAFDDKAKNVLEGTVKPDGSLVLKIYLKQQFTVTYDPGEQGTFESLITKNLDYNAETPGAPKVSGKPGYTFAGWDPEVVNTVTENTTYTAQWTQNKYTVTYTDGVGGQAFADQTTDNLVYGDETPAFNGEPKREGYTFAGWSPTVASTVTDNATYTAQWTPSKNTPYKVEHYLQNLDGSGYTLAATETENPIGTTGTLVTATPKTFEGFSHVEVAGSHEADTIAPDGSTTLRVYYDRNSYTVTYEYSNQAPEGAPSLPAAQTYRYGQSVTIADVPQVTGYVFSGWSRSETFTMPAANVTISGSWTPGNNSYKVEYYHQNLNGYGYTLAQQNTFSAITGQTVEAEIRPFEGFSHVITFRSLESAEVAADGTTTLRVYYSRNSYTVTYADGAEGSAFAAQTHTAKYGAQTPAFSGTPTRTGYTFAGWSPQVATTVQENITYTAQWRANTYTVTYQYYGDVPEGAPAAPAGGSYAYGTLVTPAQSPSLEGYTFSGWSRTSPFSMPAENVVISGSWIPARNTYRVEYYLQNTNDDGYSLGAFTTLSATTGQVVDAPNRTFEGFSHVNTANSVETATVAADGSTVLRVYYNRNTYTVIYQYTGNTPSGASALPADQVVRYGQTVTVAPNASAPGYTFSGWSITGSFTMPNNDVIISGSFTANELIPGGTVTPNPVEPTPPTQPTPPTPSQPNTPTQPTGPTYPSNQPTTPTPTPVNTPTVSLTPVAPTYNPTTPANPTIPTAAVGQNTPTTIQEAPAVDLEPLPTVTRPATQVPAAETIEEEATPLAAPVAPSEEPAVVDIVDNDTPLAAPVAHDTAECWVHILMFIGLILTAVYGVVVVLRRRSLTKPVGDYEDEILREVDGTTSATVTHGSKAA